MNVLAVPTRSVFVFNHDVGPEGAGGHDVGEGAGNFSFLGQADFGSRFVRKVDGLPGFYFRTHGIRCGGVSGNWPEHAVGLARR